MELGAEFVLEANAHFGNLLVNTSLSSVQLPTNVYNKGDRRAPARSPPGEGEEECGRGRRSWAAALQAVGTRCVCVCARVFRGGRLISFALHFLL